MRLIVVLVVLAQSSLYSAIRTPRSYPTAYSPGPNYYGQGQYGQVPQTSPYNQYVQSSPQQPTFNDGIPQQALTRPNVHYLPPSQSQKELKLPQDIDGYQLVHSGYPSTADSNQGQEVNPQLNLRNQQYVQQNQIPLQTNYPTTPNHYQNSQQLPQFPQLPPLPPIPQLPQFPQIPTLPQLPCNINNQPQQLLPQNFPQQQQQNQFEIPSQNGIYQIPQQNFQNGYLPIAQQYPFSINSLDNYNSRQQNVPQNPLQYLQQNIPQPFLQQQGAQNVQGAQGLPSNQGTTPLLGSQAIPGGQTAPQYGQYQPYTVNPISQDILPFISQPNIPQNVQNAPNPYVSSPFSSIPYPSNPLNQNPLPVNIPQQSNKGLTDFEVAGSPVTIPGPGNFQNDPLLQLLRQQQTQQQEQQQQLPQNGQFNGQGFQVFNDLRGSSSIQYPSNSKTQKQQNPEVNAEGYQVVNEGPVTHFVTMGEPNTKIVSLDHSQRPGNGQSIQSFQYLNSNYRNNNNPTNTPNQINQPQIVSNGAPQIQSQSQQPAEDCESEASSGDSQNKHPEVEIDQIRNRSRRENYNREQY